MSDKLTAGDLGGFSGGDDVYKHWLNRFVYTEGVRYLARAGGAYWLLDAIASHQTNPLARQEPFQVWVLCRTTGLAAVLEMNDGNSERAIVRQEIEPTDFPLERVELYLTGGVLLLPGEY